MAGMIPAGLTLAAKNAVGVEVLIETGTYRCATTMWAADHFREVHTIEMNEDYFELARSSMASRSNVHVHFGDSRVILPAVASQVDEPAIFWLDAHWCGNYELSLGTPGECPLVEELAYLATRVWNDVVLIDDARLFISPPPRPHDVEQWPSLARIKDLAREGFAVRVVGDVIVIAAPEGMGL